MKSSGFTFSGMLSLNSYIQSKAYQTGPVPCQVIVPCHIFIYSLIYPYKLRHFASNFKVPTPE